MVAGAVCGGRGGVHAACWSVAVTAGGGASWFIVIVTLYVCVVVVVVVLHAGSAHGLSSV